MGVILPQLQNGNPELIVEGFVLELEDNNLPSNKTQVADVIDEIYTNVFSRKDLSVQDGEEPVIAFGGKSAQNEFDERAARKNEAHKTA